MVTALVSLLTDKPVRPLTAMTGEITLSGNVLPIGGIKEKALAAKRAGVTDIILPAENKQNVEEDLTPEQTKGLNMHYVKTIDELLRSLCPALAPKRRKTPRFASRCCRRCRSAETIQQKVRRRPQRCGLCLSPSRELSWRRFGGALAVTRSRSGGARLRTCTSGDFHAPTLRRRP